MNLEIERKYLVKTEIFKIESFKKINVIQRYLSTIPERTIRVRIKGDNGYITIKGKGNKAGVSRFEWEREVSIATAKELFKLCEPGTIDKTRYYVKYYDHLFEIDEFHGENKGLIIAEIELSSEEESFIRPDWLGDEVTGDVKYFNSRLTKYPYSTWQK